MIVTQEGLISIGGCPAIVQQLMDTGYSGLTRLEFVNKLQQGADMGLHPRWWPAWGRVYLYDGNAIVRLGQFIRKQRYQVYGMNISEGEFPIFTNLQEALSAVQQKQAEQIASEEWTFHVQAQCPEGADVHTLENCDLDGDGVFDHPVDCYQVFNSATGQYECFDAFALAKLRCEELRAERCALICASYWMMEEVQQINDPEENPSGWFRRDMSDKLESSVPLISDPRFM